MVFLADDPMCPVKSLVKYKKHLNPKITTFFQRPKTKIAPDDKIWYDACAVGHNTLGSMMSKISDAAQLSQRYTNHSLRATAVHVLDAANFPSRHIMSVTGHKAETSLKTYAGYTDSNAKRNMSDEISRSVRGNVENLPPKISIPHTLAASSTCTSNSEMTDEELSDAMLMQIQVDDISIVTADVSTSSQVNIFEDVQTCDIIDMDSNESGNTTTKKTNLTSNRCTSSVTTKNVQHAPWMPQPVLNNCSNITINYNFKQ